MALEQHTKLDIARTQVDTAVQLYEARNFICAITLAGAAEEILGRMVGATGRESALEVRKAGAVALYGVLWPAETTSPKRIQGVANSTRNELKHHDAGNDASIEFDAKGDAEDMLDRAIDNYFLLEQDHTESMQQYVDRDRTGISP